MEFLNNHLLKIHQKTHNENSQDSSLQVQKKKQRENSRRQTSLKQELADDEELVDDPEELNSDTNIVNENCNENRDRNQRKAKIRANSTFRKNIESSLPKNPEGSLPSGIVTDIILILIKIKLNRMLFLSDPCGINLQLSSHFLNILFPLLTTKETKVSILKSSCRKKIQS